MPTPLSYCTLATKVADCTACGACLAACPTASIEMSEDAEGFLRPYISESSCIGCQKCLKVCPVLNHNTEYIADVIFPRTYAVIHKDASVLEKSSSGGAFSAIAEHIINNSGIVCGATYDENLQVIHRITDSVEGLQPMRGSKYAPSHAYPVFKSIAEHLKNNRLVLFTGLPCQVIGLKSYLGVLANSPLLITCDIICHGMVSNFLYKSFLSHLTAEHNGASIDSINFRHKTSNGTVLRIVFSNGKEKIIPFTQNFYYKMLLSDNCLRHSCYNCIAKHMPRQADFTIGDYWGIKRALPDLDDKQGISVLFAHNPKADKILSEIDNYVKIIPTSFAHAVCDNPSFWVSATKYPSRAKFVRYLLRNGYTKTAKHYYQRGLIKSIAYKIAHRFLFLFRRS